jgi:hypothetical protein
VEPQTVNEELSVKAEVGQSGTEQSTVDAEHLLTSNSAFKSFLIDADHRSAEACTSLLTAAQSQTEALPLCAEGSQCEVVESTVAQAIDDMDHALVQSCTSLLSKMQSVIEEFSVAADGDGTELSNSLLVNDNNYVPLAQSSPGHYNVHAAYSPRTSTFVVVNTEALTTVSTDEKSFGNDEDDDFLNSLQVNVFDDATKVTNQLQDSIMVTKIHISKKTGGIKYGLCTQHGYLQGYYYLQMSSYEPKMNAAIMNINTSKADFKQNLSVGDASMLYNRLGGKTFCRCTKDCALSKHCKCIALGRLCRDKCHSRHADGTPVQCSNCFTPALGLLHAESSKGKNSKRK